MSKTASSPTARLIQSSRLFSLPRALPSAAPSRGSSITGTFKSTTATAPYPTHQTIETPFPSQIVGDWGLKRHLPVHTTNKGGAPKVRVITQDTPDHVTNFERANDLERSLAKFQEMSIPIVKTAQTSHGYGSFLPSTTSVFEPASDITDQSSGVRGWKSRGPWIGSMTEKELDAFLVKARQQKRDLVKLISDWHTRKAFDALKDTQLKKDGYFGPLECLSDEECRELFEMRSREAGVSDELSSAQGDVNRRLSRLELATTFITIEREALQTLLQGTSDTQEAQADDQQSTANADDAKLRGALQHDATVDEACQTLLAGNKSAFTEGELEQISATQPGSADRREKCAALAHEIIESDRQRREKLQKMLEDWTRKEWKRLQPSPAEVQQLFKRLRHDFQTRGLTSDLTKFIVDYLGLPGLSVGEQAVETSGGLNLQTIASALFTDNTDALPPSTHPSAGLGYLRSTASMDNHPIFGPQARRSPVLSRVLQPRTSKFGTEHQAKLGVGGFVTRDPKAGLGGEVRKRLLALDDPDRMATSFDPASSGGNKLWVEPTRATVDETGHVHLIVLRADPEAIAVKQGDVGEILQRKRASRTGMPTTPFQREQTSPFGSSTASGSPRQRATLL